MRMFSSAHWFVFTILCLVQTIPAVTLSAPFAPPPTANSWTRYELVLQPATFGVDSAAFAQALSAVALFRIRTEMHTGVDRGGVDSVRIGTRLVSDFDSGMDGWSAGGDGTLLWSQPGAQGSGGFLDIKDWATGEWHYVVAPPSWSGDWRGLIGQSLSFHYKTDYPDQASVIEILTTTVPRIILAASPPTVVPGGSTTLTMTLSPAPTASTTITLKSSKSSCLSVPATIAVAAAQGTTSFLVTAAAGAAVGCESVIEAQVSGYATGRLTLRTQAPVVPDRFVASFGPPATIGAWTEFKVGLTAEAFHSDSVVFRNALASVKMLLVGPELSSEKDTSSLDNIRVGSLLHSSFDTGIEEWSILNDATMKWESTKGREGGCITLLDWHIGDYFYAVSPPSWAGDWSALQGDSISFFLRTNHKAKAGTVELVTGQLSRLFFTTPSTEFAPGASAQLMLHVSPAPSTALTVTLSSSSGSCISLPAMVTVPAESSWVAVPFSAASGAINCEAVIAASRASYASARLNLSVATATALVHQAQASHQEQRVAMFGLDARGIAHVIVPQGLNGVVRVYGLNGRCVLSREVSGGLTQVNSDQISGGVYIFELQINKARFSRKLRVGQP